MVVIHFFGLALLSLDESHRCPDRERRFTPWDIGSEQEGDRFYCPLAQGRANVVGTSHQMVLMPDLLIPQNLVQELSTLVEPELIFITCFQVDLQPRIPDRGAVTDGYAGRIICGPEIRVDGIAIGCVKQGIGSPEAVFGPHILPLQNGFNPGFQRGDRSEAVRVAERHP